MSIIVDIDIEIYTQKREICCLLMISLSASCVQLCYIEVILEMETSLIHPVSSKKLDMIKRRKRGMCVACAPDVSHFNTAGRQGNWA